MGGLYKLLAIDLSIQPGPGPVQSPFFALMPQLDATVLGQDPSLNGRFPFVLDTKPMGGDMDLVCEFQAASLSLAPEGMERTLFESYFLDQVGPERPLIIYVSPDDKAKQTNYIRGIRSILKKKSKKRYLKQFVEVISDSDTLQQRLRALGDQSYFLMVNRGCSDGLSQIRKSGVMGSGAILVENSGQKPLSRFMFTKIHQRLVLGAVCPEANPRKYAIFMNPNNASDYYRLLGDQDRGCSYETFSFRPEIVHLATQIWTHFNDEPYVLLKWDLAKGSGIRTLPIRTKFQLMNDLTKLFSRSRGQKDPFILIETISDSISRPPKLFKTPSQRQSAERRHYVWKVEEGVQEVDQLPAQRNTWAGRPWFPIDSYSSPRDVYESSITHKKSRFSPEVRVQIKRDITPTDVPIESILSSVSKTSQ